MKAQNSNTHGGKRFTTTDKGSILMMKQVNVNRLPHNGAEGILNVSVQQ